MRSLPRRLAALATVLLTLAMAAVLALRAAGAPIGLGHVPDDVMPSAAVPSPTRSEDPQAVFAAIERQVADVRELRPADIGPPDLITRAQLADELRRVLDDAWTPEQLAADNLTLRAMGLLTDAQDIRKLTESLYNDQVLGFYDFDKKRMVVVSDAGLTAEAKITYAHEFTHAMQDAAFDTGAHHRAGEAQEDDVTLASLALEEGDASVAMIRWAFGGNLSPDELAGIGATPVPKMRGIPHWMVQQLTFPYESGAEFVSQLFARNGWDAVDAAYAAPPSSTEQVIHVEKYLEGEKPIAVEGLSPAQRLGRGWRDVESTTIGEAMIHIWLGQLGVRDRTARDAAAGWGGDRLTVARGPGGAWAMTWRVAWDSPAEANEFLAASAAEETANLPFATRTLRIDQRTTLTVHASSAALLASLGGG
jgi:hypothetical protein